MFLIAVGNILGVGCYQRKLRLLLINFNFQTCYHLLNPAITLAIQQIRDFPLHAHNKWKIALMCVLFTHHQASL